MKRFYFSKLAILATLLLGFSSVALAQTITYNYTGSVQYYTVPTGVTAVNVDMAGGAGGNSNCSGIGGKGGRVVCDMNVTPGQILPVYVAGGGTNYVCCSYNAGGFVGGGNGYQYGGGGGGASDIRTPGNQLTDRLVVAGGGGGAGYNWCNEQGGAGGGLTGGVGYSYSGNPTNYYGGGGTQTAGGIYSTETSPYGQAGSFGAGGTASTGYGGGGGGGGYYGGGSGSYYCPGGGGSSYTNTVVCSNVQHSQGTQSGNGYVTIKALVPTVISTPTSLNFGVQTVGTPSVPKYVSLNGLRLTGFPSTLTITPPAGFLISADGITWYSSTSPLPLGMFYGGATMPATNLYVQFVPGFAIAYCSGSILVTGGGQPTNLTIPVCGTGVSPCSGLPTPGAASALPGSAGVSTPITLSLTGSTVGGSIAYQWQQSIDAGATWTNINGAVQATSTIFGILGNTMFRCQVTCPTGGTSISTTASVTFVAAAMANSSCTPTCANTPNCCGFWVGNSSSPFVLNGDGGTKINDNNPATGTKYFDFTSSQSVTLTAGNTYSCTNGYSASNPNSFQIWIDFNNDGVFSTSESVGGVNWNTSTVMPATAVVIPATAAGGTYRMRAQVDYASGCGSSTPCYPNLNPCPTTAISYAETRDYTANISFPNCSGTPNPGIAYTPVVTNCGPFNANLYNVGPTSNLTGLTYQWQSSPDSVSWTDIAGANNLVYTQAVTSTLFYRAKTTCAFGGNASTFGVKITQFTQPAPITGTSTFCSAIPTPLSCTTPGGSWSSSNPAVASVGTSGVVTGMSAGTATISYALPTGCLSTKVVTVFLSPSAITGASNVCTSLTATLSNATPGGVWTSSNGAFASIGSSSGIVTGIAPGALNVTYTIPAGGCNTSFPITVNTLPGPITGSNNVCAGSSTTLSNSVAGGIWSSSNSFLANVTPGTGLVTGVVASSPVISYTLPGGCFQVLPMTVNPLPGAITGATNVCAGSTTALSSSTAGGVWATSNGSIATVVPGTGVVTGVAGGSVNISYTLTATGCATNTGVNVNLLPAVFSVGGGGGYCSGTAGAHVTLSNSAVGVNYNLYANGSFVATLPGSATALDFGAMSAVATYTVQATDAGTACTTGMAGSVNVFVNSLPSPYVLSAVGAGAYCFGGTGVDLRLSSSDVGVNYQLWNGLPIGAPVAGTGVGTLDLGYQTGAGSYTVIATNVSTLCNNTMTGSPTVSINMPPTVFNVSGTASFCSGGGGVPVMLSGSTIGVTYYLNKGVTPMGSMAGTGSAITFPNQTAFGTYSVIGTDAAGCTSTMSGNAVVSVNPLPVIQTVNGGGAYCFGGSGKHIGLVYSDAGTTYDLMDATPTSVATVAGSNSGLDFGPIVTAGVYTVLATNSYSCTATMSGTASVSVNLLPNPYLVTGGGGYCIGDPGVHVKLFSSDPGVHYQLYRSGSIVGSPMNGTGGQLDFGLFTIPGFYTIVATNGTTGCTNNMTGGVNVTVNSLPLVYNVTGGGAYCAGAGGVAVNLSKSESGVDYYLYNNGTFAFSIPGTGSGITFGLLMPAGAYTVKATNPTTTCSSNMAGSVTVVVNPLPLNYTVTGGGAYCAGGAGMPLGLNSSNPGVDYQVLISGVPTGVIQGGTGKAINFGTFAAGSYTVKATNTLSGCTNETAPTPIVMNSLPTQFTVSGGGNICSTDTGKHIFLSGSTTGISYQLYNGSTISGAPKAGGGALDLGLRSAAGTYTVVAKDPVTTCTNTMISSAVINVTPAPKLYTVTGGGRRCASDLTGLAFNLSGSDVSTRYQVYNGVTMDGSFFAGTGLPIYLGAHTGAGTYSVIATDAASGCSSTMAGAPSVTIKPSTTPTIKISPSGGSDTVCAGSKTTFVSLTSNGGSSPKYLWKVNGIPAGTASTLTYGVSNGDVVTAYLTDVDTADCPSPATVASNDVNMDVFPSSLPTASVTVTPSAFVCPGTPVTFSATSTYGHNTGGTDNYSWYLNGNLAATGPSFAYTPSDSIIVFASMVSSYTCRTTDYVLSNNVPVAINEPVLPLFTIGEITSTSVNKGESVTLKAIVSNPGSYTYQWYVHGAAVNGATKATFTANYYNDQEVVKCVVTSHGVCGGLSTTQSTLINVRDNTGVKNVTTGGDVRVVPNPNKGAFTVKGSLGTTLDETVSLEITNMLGQVVYTNKVMSHGGNINEQIQLNNTLANGMYILNLRSDSDNQVFHFVIEQ